MTLAPIFDWIIQFGSLSAVGAAVGGITAALVNWFMEGRKFKREQRIAHLKERLDGFYTPLLFHFENMKSWAIWLGSPDKYAFSQPELERKLEDMYQIMRSGMRLASPEVTRLWFEWQPTASSTHPTGQASEFIKRSQKLHEAVKADFEKLRKAYLKEIAAEKSS